MPFQYRDGIFCFGGFNHRGQSVFTEDTEIQNFKQAFLCAFCG